MKCQTNYNPFQNFISFSKEMGSLLCKLETTYLKYVFSENTLGRWREIKKPLEQYVLQFPISDSVIPISDSVDAR